MQDRLKWFLDPIFNGGGAGEALDKFKERSLVAVAWSKTMKMLIMFMLNMYLHEYLIYSFDISFLVGLKKTGT